MVRFKNRYLVLELIYPTLGDGGEAAPDAPPPSLAWTAGKLAGVLRQGLQDTYGDWGVGCCAGSLVVKYMSPVTGMAIVRVAREHVRLVQSTATFTTHLVLNGREGTQIAAAAQGSLLPLVLRTLHISGTIKKAQKALLQYNRAIVLRVASSAGQKKPSQGEMDRAMAKEKADLLMLEP